MDQLRKLFKSLSIKQRASIGLVAALVLACLYGVSNWRRDVDFKPLYTGVAAEDAGTIIRKIKESGVEYRLSDSGGVISVPSASVAELRLQLAEAGLPKSGRIGFEIFDKTTFGSTEFVEHINYERALEGELEKSVSSLAAIEQARVHLTFSKDSVFIESREPAKASVVLKIRPGMALSTQNVAAIQQLVASAVEGLNTEGVSVVDTLGGLLSRKRRSAEEDASSDAYAYRRRIEHDLIEKINLTLDPMLGHDRYRAAVSVDCDLTSGEQNEETFDPTKSVMSNSQKTEDMTTGTASGGIPGSASNLPRPPARPGGTGSTTSRRTENVSYESSHLVRRTLLPQGSVKRISVSVLLDQRVTWEGKGNAAKEIFVPPSAETLKAVHDIVAGMSGFNQERGDQIVVETVPFQSTIDQPPPAGAAPKGQPAPKPTDWHDWLHNPAALIGAAAGGALVLVLAMAVFFLRRKRSPGVTVTNGPKEIAASNVLLVEDPDTGSAAIVSQSAHEEALAAAALASFKLPIVSTKKSEILVRELRDATKKDATAPAQVLQTWIRGNE